LVDLWREEGGLDVEPLYGISTGWEYYQKAAKEGRGVLLVSPHLGNWEFGGAWMHRRGAALTILTLAEPGGRFTLLRKQSRSQRQIDTLVIGDDKFAFVEVIRRLEAGAAVALLIDRPPAPTAVTVTLFGRPFQASVAAAELARASGCVILPVYIPRVGNRYDAHILPPVTYDRPGLRERAARQQLTQRIIGSLEPIIHDHLDQWYHFVPLWRRGGD
jgi:KDO2-lipid IV(A) lauroyltransferase